MAIFKSTQSSDDSLTKNFKLLLDSVSNLFEQEGLKVKAYKTPELNSFQQLNIADKTQVFQALSNYQASLELTLSAGHSLKSAQRSLWAGLKSLNLRPSSDIFDLIKDSQIVEVYSLTGLQIWRNLSFMEVCSYNLEEIFCHSWEERYERDHNAMEKIGTVLQDMSARPEVPTVKIDVRNILIEKFSEEQLTIDVRHEYLSTLKDEGGNMAGFIALSSGKILGANNNLNTEPMPQEPAHPHLHLV